MTDLPIRNRIFSTLRLNASPAELETQKELEIIQEYAALKTFQTAGVYLLPSAEDIRVWNGIIFVRAGLYRDSIFKFSIKIPSEYPIASPTVHFLSAILHPLVGQDTRELNILPKFPQWRPNKDFLFLLVKYIRDILYSCALWTVEHAVNLDALKLYTCEPDTFSRLVGICVEDSYESVYEAPPDFAIRISKYGQQHRKVYEMVKCRDTEASEQEMYESFMARFKREYR